MLDFPACEGETATVKAGYTIEGCYWEQTENVFDKEDDEEHDAQSITFISSRRTPRRAVLNIRWQS